jgi:hypothetical protein
VPCETSGTHFSSIVGKVEACHSRKPRRGGFLPSEKVPDGLSLGTWLCPRPCPTILPPPALWFGAVWELCTQLYPPLPLGEWVQVRMVVGPHTLTFHGARLQCCFWVLCHAAVPLNPAALGPSFRALWVTVGTSVWPKTNSGSDQHGAESSRPPSLSCLLQASCSSSYLRGAPVLTHLACGLNVWPPPRHAPEDSWCGRP